LKCRLCINCCLGLPKPKPKPTNLSTTLPKMETAQSIVTGQRSGTLPVSERIKLWQMTAGSPSPSSLDSGNTDTNGQDRLADFNEDLTEGDSTEEEHDTDAGLTSSSAIASTAVI